MIKLKTFTKKKFSSIVIANSLIVIAKNVARTNIIKQTNGIKKKGKETT